MEFDAVEAGGKGVDGGLAKLFDDAGDLAGFEGTRGFEGDHADAVDPGFDVRENGGRGNGLGPAGEELGMGDTTAVHDL